MFAHPLAVIVALCLNGTAAWAGSVQPTEISQTDRKAMMTAVCGTMPERDEKGIWSCRSCPDYTSFSGEVTDSPTFHLRKVYPGSFTAHKPQVLATMYGCEPHSNNFGGTALLERTGQVWHQLDFFPSALPSECLEFKAQDGLTTLACYQSAEYNGGVESAWVDFIRSTGTTLGVEDLFAGLGDRINALNSEWRDFLCWDWALDIKKDAAQPERALLVDIRGARRSPNSEENGWVMCGKNVIAASTVKGHFILRYLFDGLSMTLDPNSKGEMSALKAFLSTPGKRD